MAEANKGREKFYSEKKNNMDITLNSMHDVNCVRKDRVVADIDTYYFSPCMNEQYVDDLHITLLITWIV